MNLTRLAAGAGLALTFALASLAASAADYPAPKEGTYVAKNFVFHDGATLPELKLHYLTIGEPSGEPVLILHGTAGSAAGLMTPSFAGELFGPGQPLDAGKYFIIVPDSIGAGKSSKPSDGMRAAFPRYDYADMVEAQRLVVTQALGLKHLRLILGNSMGGMHAWIWGVSHPDFMDALAPMASQPAAMSSRNWMMRRMVIDAVRNDPDWKGGDYAEQPKAVRVANAFFGIATSGGSIAYQKAAPTREKADALLAERLAAPLPLDANDYLYQWESSADYDPSDGVGRITAPTLAINSADDERNPPETRVMERALKRMAAGQLFLIPASEDTRGHGTTGMAKFWKRELAEWLPKVPHRAAPAD